MRVHPNKRGIQPERRNTFLRAKLFVVCWWFSLWILEDQAITYRLNWISHLRRSQWTEWRADFPWRIKIRTSRTSSTLDRWLDGVSALPCLFEIFSPLILFFKLDVESTGDPKWPSDPACGARLIAKRNIITNTVDELEWNIYQASRRMSWCNKGRNRRFCCGRIFVTANVMLFVNEYQHRGNIKVLS